MGSTIYSLEKLLALRHSVASPESLRDSPNRQRFGSYLASFARYQKLVCDGPDRTMGEYPWTIVYKYDPLLSNKQFKHRWVQTHGTTAGLKDLHRVRVNVRSIRVKYLEVYFKRLARLELSLARQCARLRKETRFVEVKLPLPLVRNLMNIKPGAWRKCQDNKRVVQGHAYRITKHDDGNESFNTLGGTVKFRDPRAPPPEGKWPKYWYFYRRRGIWSPSEHHPYGDEG
jgi:hypothetical protein